MNKKQKQLLTEELADYAHDSWCRWMSYLFKKASIIRHPATVELNLEIKDFDRWSKQMKTFYKSLPNEEKQSDFEQAEMIMEIIEKYLAISPK